MEILWRDGGMAGNTYHIGQEVRPIFDHTNWVKSTIVEIRNTFRGKELLLKNGVIIAAKDVITMPITNIVKLIPGDKF